MMGLGGWGMMGGAGFLSVAVWFLVIIDLVLVGVWLWQQISKK